MLDLFLNETVLLKIIRQIFSPCNIDPTCTRKGFETIARKLSSHIIFFSNSRKCNEKKVFSGTVKFFHDKNLIQRFTRKETMTTFVTFIKIAGNNQKHFDC